MQFFLAATFLAIQLTAFAQTKADTIQLIRNSVKLYDLEFSDAEADSMIDGITYFNGIYKNVHKMLPANDIPLPPNVNPKFLDRTVALPVGAG